MTSGAEIPQDPCETCAPRLAGKPSAVRALATSRSNENVGGGSKLKVAVVPYFWYTASLGAGITLQPKAVQILDLVTWSSGGSAEAYGFEVTEAPKQVVRTGTNNEEVEW